MAANIDHLPTTPVESLDMVILAKKLQALEQRLHDKCDELSARLSSIEVSLSMTQSTSDLVMTTDNFTLLESRIVALEAGHSVLQPQSHSATDVDVITVVSPVDNDEEVSDCY